MSNYRERREAGHYSPTTSSTQTPEPNDETPEQDKAEQDKAEPQAKDSEDEAE